MWRTASSSRPTGAMGAMSRRPSMRCCSWCSSTDLKQAIEVVAVLDEAIAIRAAVGQLVGIAHTDQVRRDATAQRLQVRQHVAPEVGRGGIAVQQHDGVALSHLHVRHLAVVDSSPLLLVRKCRRDHFRFSFFVVAEYHQLPCRRPWTPVVAGAIALSKFAPTENSPPGTRSRNIWLGSESHAAPAASARPSAGLRDRKY